jgi:Ca2+-dependent lipid-binding protein
MNSQRVRLEIHAAKLCNTAGTFKTSDPYAVVTLLANNPNEQPRVLGKTEVIPNSLNPRWITHFDLDYCIGQLTRLNVGVYDDVKKGTHKPMGSAMFEVGEVLGTRGNVKAKQLRNGGTLFVRIMAAPGTSHGTLHLKLCGHQLKNVDGIFGKSDPFFELSYKVQDSAGGLIWQPVYRSEPVKNDLNPRWPAFAVDLGRLCGGDLNQPIQFKIYDWQKNGKHTWMGTFETNVNALLAAVVAEPRDTKNVDTSKAFHVVKRSRLAAGQVIVTEARVDGRSGQTYTTTGQPFASTVAPTSYTSPPPVPEQYFQAPQQTNAPSSLMPF